MNWRTFIWALWVAAVTFVSAEKGLEFPVHDGKDRLVNLRCVFGYFRTLGLGTRDAHGLLVEPSPRSGAESGQFYD